MNERVRDAVLVFGATVGGLGCGLILFGGSLRVGLALALSGFWLNLRAAVEGSE